MFAKSERHDKKKIDKRIQMSTLAHKKGGDTHGKAQESSQEDRQEGGWQEEKSGQEAPLSHETQARRFERSE